MFEALSMVEVEEAVMLAGASLTRESWRRTDDSCSLRRRSSHFFSSTCNIHIYIYYIYII